MNGFKMCHVKTIFRQFLNMGFNDHFRVGWICPISDQIIFELGNVPCWRRIIAAIIDENYSLAFISWISMYFSFLSLWDTLGIRYFLGLACSIEAPFMERTFNHFSLN